MRIKNWAKFQHFKDRRPPWIKLYRDLLDDIDWHELDDKSAKVLVMLWLIASEDDGALPDMKKLAFRLRMKESDVSACCSKLSHWLDHDDIELISSGYQSDAPETEKETEKRQKRDDTLQTPDGVSDDVWKAFLKVRKAKKAPMSDLALEGIRREADKAGWSLEDALAECVTRGWQAFKADWVEKRSGGTPTPMFAGCI